MSTVIRKKKEASMLSKELLKEHKTRSLGVRKGDIVFVMRGEYKGMEGRVTRLDKKNRIYIDGITREKADGNTVFVPIHTSKVKISKLNLKDKRRKEILERKASISIPNLDLEKS
jgi:large subunit ribosomal protein L24